ncbi:MAG: hypothetical protein KY429_01520 [Actinobacteria bacterium]|nr:hypothetical protein [Actinomycetota bacterium]
MEFLTERGKELSERAEKVFEQREYLTKTPVMVEFAGTPKSGKTSSIEVVNHFFHRHEFKVFAPTEGVSKRTPRALKKDLLYYNVWAACYALQQMFEARFHPDNFELAIFDRGIFDFLGWIDWLLKNGEIAKKDRTRIEEFILLKPWKDMLDLVVLFECKPAIAMQRENSHKLIAKAGRAMNEPVLAELNASYVRTAVRHRNLFNFHHVNTDSEEEQDTNTEILIDAVLGLLEAGIDKPKDK